MKRTGRYVERAPIMVLLACVPAIALGACSSPSTADPTAAGSSGQDASVVGTRGLDPADSGAPGENATARSDMEQVGADYATALADSGLPVPPAANYATLAQVARGICSQLAAGTSEAKIRAQLEPISQFAVSQAQGPLDAATASQTYLDAARTHIC